MNYWLVKTEPDTYGWSNLEKDRKTTWDGVRNFQARKHLKEMKRDDKVLFYHTGDEKAVVGIARVVREAFPDPTDAAWVVVDLSPEKRVTNPVTLAQIKADKRLANMVLVKAARLSVQPVKKDEFDLVLALSEEK
jgi:predicted RNA-binding protein with PUA-like domain